MTVTVTETSLYGSNLGRTDGTYAIATTDRLGVPLRLDQIAKHIEQFLTYARANPGDTFVIQSGLASAYARPAIAALFADAPPNCQLPRDLKP